MNKTNAIPKSKKFIFRITTIIIATVFLITGFGNLLPFQHIAGDMSRLGYPLYFLKILGFWKVVAGLVIILPIPAKFKDFAYVGMMLDLTGAALSRFFVGDTLPTILVPIGISIMVTLNFLIRNSLYNQRNTKLSR